MDPSKSRQISFLDNFMVAIMKELHVKQDDNASDSIDMLERDRNSSLNFKRK
jgi:hypothetical protein